MFVDGDDEEANGKGVPPAGTAAATTAGTGPLSVASSTEASNVNGNNSFVPGDPTMMSGADIVDRVKAAAVKEGDKYRLSSSNNEAKAASATQSNNNNSSAVATSSKQPRVVNDKQTNGRNGGTDPKGGSSSNSSKKTKSTSSASEVAGNGASSAKRQKVRRRNIIFIVSLGTFCHSPPPL